MLGGPAVTEEIVPGFHFSRASYVFSLFRPQTIRDLDLHKYGLVGKGQSLTLGSDMANNQKQIGKSGFYRDNSDE
ncbi:hypothetical protein DYB38_000639 [Aphanomyces astaci]|uniref:Uncharacterized protein n=1 Tax=Aphanomyces astaci TaxID=112090 RepID=A0A397D576_APHAT|nr:hypothetical protein DYB38_000639 [Aphanomyces astaci]